MNFPRFIKLLLALCIPILLGCAASTYNRGSKSLAQDDYGAAIASFKETLSTHPDDYRAHRELGVAYFRQGNYDEALQSLLRAYRLRNDDGRLLFYLGMTLEDQNRSRYAILVYQQYINVNPASGIRDDIEARLASLLRKEMALEARKMLTQETQINAGQIPDNTVAVLYFQNMGNKRGLDPLQKGLTDMLITDLSKVNRLTVIERVQMQKLMEEMGLGMTGFVDEETAPRVGKLLGASTLVKGTYLDMTDYGFRVDAGLIKTRERTIQTHSINGRLLELFQLEKDLVFDLIDKMGVTISQAERDEIEIIPTENILAFMAYCRGMDFDDRGMFNQAAQEYQKAVDLDPNFNNAQNNLGRSQKMAAPLVRVAELEKKAPREEPRDQRVAVTDRADQSNVAATSPVTSIQTFSVRDQLVRIGTVLNQGFLPGIDMRTPTTDQSTASFGNTANLKIRVALPIQ